MKPLADCDLRLGAAETVWIHIDIACCHSSRSRVWRVDKPPILLLHGAWLSVWCWRDWMTVFHAHGHTVIVPSYRAHGHSSQTATLRWTRLSPYVEDAISLAGQLESSPIVIAHSMGGAVAQRILETVSAAALVLVASVPPAGALGQISKWLAVFVNRFFSNTSRNKGVLHALVTCAAGRFVDNLCARRPKRSA